MEEEEEANFKRKIIEIRRRSIEDELPFDLIIKILLKVPTMILLTRMRCVCKLWRNTIDSSWFINEYNISTINDNDNNNLDSCVESQILRYAGQRTEENKLGAALISLNNDGGSSSRPPTPIAMLEFTNNFWYCGYGLFYSYVISTKFRPINGFLFNPLRGGEAMLLPEKNYSTSYRCEIFGIGFDITTATYKFIRVYEDANNSNNLVAEIYALGTREWREIPMHNLPCPFPEYEKRAGTSAYGDVHWIARSNMIVSFDTRQETFKVTPPPKSSSRQFFQLFEHKIYLGMADFVSDYRYTDFVIDIWLLKGHNKMWAKQHTISFQTLHFRFSHWISLPTVIGLRKDGTVILDHWSPDLTYSYNLKTRFLCRLYESLGNDTFSWHKCTFLYTGNLLSLKNYYGGFECVRSRFVSSSEE